MVDVGTVLQGVIGGAVCIACYVLWKTRDADPNDEFTRGEADARHFHKQGVPIWEMKGFVNTRKAIGQAGPYEAGMTKYINEVLKVETR